MIEYEVVSAMRELAEDDGGSLARREAAGIQKLQEDARSDATNSGGAAAGAGDGYEDVVLSEGDMLSASSSSVDTKLWTRSASGKRVL